MKTYKFKYVSGDFVSEYDRLMTDLKEAQKLSYNAVKSISFEGAFFRKDIGHKGFK